MKKIVILQFIILLFGCSTPNSQDVLRYLSYIDSLNENFDTIVYTFYAWPQSLDSLKFDKGICKLIDNDDIISDSDTFSIFKYQLVDKETLDTSFYFFHNTFSDNRHLIFIQQPVSGSFQILIDPHQYKQHGLLYDLIENDTTGYFLPNEAEITSVLRYEGVFL